jgi:hypothetical protein
MNRFALLLILAVAVPFTVVQAGEPTAQQLKPIQSVISGTGGFSCGQFIEYEKQGNPQQMDLIVQWVWGFLVAYNSRGFFNNNIGHDVIQVTLPDSPTVLLFISEFCKRRPLSNVVGATTELIQSLGGPIVWRPDAGKK